MLAYYQTQNYVSMISMSLYLMQIVPKYFTNVINLISTVNVTVAASMTNNRSVIVSWKHIFFDSIKLSHSSI